MTPRQALYQQLNRGLVSVDAERLRHLGEHYEGKVRDLFIGDEVIVMITSDRLSAFDVVLTSIPCKGAILNAIAAHAFEQTADICANHLIDAPHPNVLRVRRAQPLPIEIIVRRHVTGSLWRDVVANRHGVYEVALPSDLRKDQRLDELIITPTTKAAVGAHDEPISRANIVARGLVTAEVLDRAYDVALQLFCRGEALAAERGLILVDTKYEMGLIDGELVLIDEIHTADSSRYWLADTFDERFAAGDEQAMLDKENIRRWLMAQGYTGDGPIPAFPDDVRLDLAEVYMRLHERLLGQPFQIPEGDVAEAVYAALGS